MRKIICCAVVLISLTKALLAQPYTVENGKTRHRFAQLNVGLDTRVFLSGGSQTHFVNSGGQLESDALENHTEARIIMGVHISGAMPIFTLGFRWSLLIKRDFRQVLKR
ncbi:MAG: hypothetical protein IPL74_08660 [Bacteroidetes bacterium]|nr:hypothetical protein [Bacteroidota bacterium]